MKQKTWTISELAHEFSITPRTLRFYEDQGILAPTRKGRNRVYHPRDRTRLKLALRGRRLGFQVAEIVSLIDMYVDSGDTVRQLQHYLDILSKHRKRLEQQRSDLELTLKEIEQQQNYCKKLLREKRKPSTDEDSSPAKTAKTTTKAATKTTAKTTKTATKSSKTATKTGKAASKSSKTATKASKSSTKAKKAATKKSKSPAKEDKNPAKESTDAATESKNAAKNESNPASS